MPTVYAVGIVTRVSLDPNSFIETTQFAVSARLSNIE
jgi:hypothetical protein